MSTRKMWPKLSKRLNISVLDNRNIKMMTRSLYEDNLRYFKCYLYLPYVYVLVVNVEANRRVGRHLNYCVQLKYTSLVQKVCFVYVLCTIKKNE